jgi:hypothetical protein
VLTGTAGDLVFAFDDADGHRFVPHSAKATTRAFGYADRLSPDPA